MTDDLNQATPDAVPMKASDGLVTVDLHDQTPTSDNGQPAPVSDPPTPLGADAVEQARQEIEAVHQQQAEGSAGPSSQDAVAAALEQAHQDQGSDDADEKDDRGKDDQDSNADKSNDTEDDDSAKDSHDTSDADTKDKSSKQNEPNKVETALADKLEPVAQKLVGKKTSGRKLRGYVLLLPYFALILVLFILILIILKH